MRISIIGSGVVGSATGRGLLTHGHEVTFVDANPARVDELRADGLTAVLPSDHDFAATELSMISVNTPTIAQKVDTANLHAAVKALAEGLRRDTAWHMVVVRSTVPPGTTLGPVRRLLETHSGRLLGRDLGLAMNPEFLRQRSALDDFLQPWLTVFGAAGEREEATLRRLYEPFGAPVVAVDPTTAEVIKYAHNLYNATKISFFNEFHRLCESIGIDSTPIGEVVARSAEGMWRPAYGTRGGYPYDGACLPKDTVGFLTFATELGIDMPLLRATIAVNESMQERFAYPIEPTHLVSLASESQDVGHRAGGELAQKTA